MKKIEFKTNVKCGACVATITPEMEKLSLTVEGNLEEEAVLEALEKSGYKGEIIS
jgi:copper chaperone